MGPLGTNISLFGSCLLVGVAFSVLDRAAPRAHQATIAVATGDGELSIYDLQKIIPDAGRASAMADSGLAVAASAPPNDQKTAEVALPEKQPPYPVRANARNVPGLSGDRIRIRHSLANPDSLSFRVSKTGGGKPPTRIAGLKLRPRPLAYAARQRTNTQATNSPENRGQAIRTRPVLLTASKTMRLSVTQMPPPQAGSSHDNQQINAAAWKGGGGPGTRQNENSRRTGPNPPRTKTIDALSTNTPATDAPKSHVPDIYALNTAAYDALARGELASARAIFEQSLAKDPGQSTIHTQVAYLDKSSGRYSDARISLASAAGITGDLLLPAPVLRMKNDLERPLRLSGFTQLRTGSRLLSENTDLAFGPSLAQDQGGVGATLRLPVDGWASLHDVSAFARTLWAYDDEGLVPRGDTLQVGVGLQFRPFKKLNLLASAERLIAVGDQARDDFMLRLSYSAGQGYVPPIDRSTWLFWSAYSDLAVIDPVDPDVQLLGDARIGVGLRPSKNKAIAVIANAGLSANHQDAAGQRTDLVEANAGLWLRFWGLSPEIADPRRALDLRVEYRAKLSGNSQSSSGVMMTVSAVF